MQVYLGNCCNRQDVNKSRSYMHCFVKETKPLMVVCLEGVNSDISTISKLEAQ